MLFRTVQITFPSSPLPEKAATLPTPMTRCSNNLKKRCKNAAFWAVSCCFDL
jgi:hypothetical protein